MQLSLPPRLRLPCPTAQLAPLPSSARSGARGAEMELCGFRNCARKKLVAVPADWLDFVALVQVDFLSRIDQSERAVSFTMAVKTISSQGLNFAGEGD